MSNEIPLITQSIETPKSAQCIETPQSKEDGKDRESIQSNTTPVPGHHKGK